MTVWESSDLDDCEEFDLRTSGVGGGEALRWIDDWR